MPDLPELEMVTAEMYGYDTLTQPQEKRKLSLEAKRIREQMIGYADTVIERQDRYDVLKATESFQQESKVRKTLREMTGYYTETS